MCELFAVSSSKPVRLRYSLHEFALHGGLLHPNKSGWGIAYHEGSDALLIKEPAPASDSPWVRFIETQPLTSTCIIAHVRYATAGPPSFPNTHPFVRELGGRTHLFAHNGGMEGIWGKLPLSPDGPQPVGDTDSEYAFCVLLGRLAPLWRGAGSVPLLEERLQAVSDAAADFRRLGPSNFLYSDSDVLFAHSHKRHWDENGSFSEARPPGLCIGNHPNLAVRGLHVQLPEDLGQVSYVASVPLTEDGWDPLPEATVVALRGGQQLARMAPIRGG